MPRMKPDVLEEFLQLPTVGVISTLRRDGMPYTVPVWWLWKPDGIWITGTYNRVWCKQLMHDPRASLCIESGPPLTGHVEFDGRCTTFDDLRCARINRRTWARDRRPRRGSGNQLRPHVALHRGRA